MEELNHRDTETQLQDLSLQAVPLCLCGEYSSERGGEMRSKLEHVRGGGRGERGSVLALSAVGMVVFLAAVGLCVDVSHFYLVNAELQNAADAASLAAASALNSQPAGITKAVERATEELKNNYDFNNKEADIGPDQVTFAVN